MKRCIPINGSTITIEQSQCLTWQSSIDDALSAVEECLQSAAPTTGQEVVDVAVRTLSEHLLSISLEDQLELSAVIDYPGDSTELPAEIAVAETFEVIVSRVGTWHANRGSPQPAEP